MKPLIYLIGKNPSYMEKIEQVLGTDVLIRHVSKSNLMSEIYKSLPQSIVIIEDDLDGDGFLLVDSTISLEYIPTICVSFSKETWQVERYIKHATYMHEKDMDILLPSLIDQAKHFTKRYHAMHICQDTYDVMNEEIRSSMEAYLLEDEKYDHKVLQNYLSLIYVDNFFLDNSPRSVWMIKKNSDFEFVGYHFPVAGQCDYYEKVFEDCQFSFAPFMETGFFKNNAIAEYSDIDEVEQLIPEALMEVSDEISNIAAFAMHDMMLIAMNYNEKIRQSDLNILKALTIKMDLMVTIKDKMSALEASFDYTMNALARAAEGKDDVTGHHIRRVNYYSRMIAMALGLDSKFVKGIMVAAQMHDVGKIFIPETVLNKPGKLTDEEFALMQSHTVQGEVIIGDSQDLRMAANIARSHHEKYDGTGYPDKLKGEEIPLEARIVGLADIYDALRSKRSYKRAFTHEEAYRIIVEGDGRVEPHHFDPDVLKVFIERHEFFDEVYTAYRD